MCWFSWCSPCVGKIKKINKKAKPNQFALSRFRPCSPSQYPWGRRPIFRSRVIASRIKLLTGKNKKNETSHEFLSRFRHLLAACLPFFRRRPISSHAGHCISESKVVLWSLLYLSYIIGNYLSTINTLFILFIAKRWPLRIPL